MAEENSETVKLNSERRYAVYQMKKTFSNMEMILKKEPTTENVPILDAYLTDAAAARSRFEDIQKQLLYLLDPENKNFQKAEEDIFKESDSVVSWFGHYTGKIQAFKTSIDSAANRNSILDSSLSVSELVKAPSPRLPKIEIPAFDGNIRKFYDFISLFKNLVHNNFNLTKIQKLYYLKNSLTGDASNIIKDVQLTDSAYDEVWSRLNDRYDNRRLIIKTYLSDLFSIMKAKNESELRRVLDSIDRVLKGLKILGEPVYQWSTLMSYYLSQKIDDVTKRDWENSLNDNSVFPPFSSIQKFVEIRATNAETRVAEKPKERTAERRKPDSKFSFNATNAATCIACGNSHLLIDCATFLSKSPQERLDLVRLHHLCTNCFGRSHSSRECKKRTCKFCPKKHNSLLHLENRPETKASASVTANQNKTDSTVVSNLSCLNTNQTAKSVVLPSAVVTVLYRGASAKARLLFDNCSQVTLVSDSFVKKLRIPTCFSNSETHIKGIGGTVTTSNHSCYLKLISRHQPFELNVQADIVPSCSLPYLMENLKISAEPQQLKNFQLADPAFYRSPVNISSIDILIGAEYFERCMLNETRSLDYLTLRNTHFGWIISGPVYQHISSPSTTQKTSFLALHTLEDNMKKFWEIEEVADLKTTEDEEAVKCEEYFMQNHTRTADGQFMVRLPFKPNITDLGHSESKAIASLHRLERRLKPDIRKQYSEFMTEYAQLNHMELKPKESEAKYSIPMLVVLRPSSTTTKLRVVFNASAKTSSGLSLNDTLTNGPIQQNELFDILLQFRKHRVALVADIEKMYRSVLVHPSDRPYQAVFWRNPTTEVITQYYLSTVTYGTKPAAYLATKCLTILAESVRETNPTAADAIRNHFYMDDILTGAESVEAAIHLRETIHSVLSSAKFHLRKYQSNSPEFLATIDPNEIETNLTHNFHNKESISVLGLSWRPADDSFAIKLPSVPKELPNTLTKRLILAQISSVFDPLGFAAPVTIRGKIFMQRLWLEQCTWDQPLPDNLSNDYHAYYADLSSLQLLSIPRPYHTLADVPDFQLIGFCDASEKAYCAVVYLRAKSSRGEISSLIICAKTRVAPIKLITIPRLELQAAVLLTRLLGRVASVFKIQPEAVYAYSDSEIVLSWLSKPAQEWKPFVANRVRIVTEHLSVTRWRYVHTRENPADLGTRGISANALVNSKLWLHGPSFLSHESFDDLCQLKIDSSLSLEKRNSPKTCLIAVKNLQADDSFIIRLSNYNTLILIVARILSLFNRNNKKYSVPFSSLSYADTARLRIIRIVQIVTFNVEYKRLLQAKPMKKRSSLKSLEPFLDHDQLIRVGGRLRNADVSYDKKHPIIVPVKHHFTTILIRHIHEKYFHASRNFIAVHLKAQYHFLGSLTLAIKKVINLCTVCIRFRAETKIQLMADLPATRVSPSRPFSCVGIDFAGPFECRPIHRSKIRYKIYAAVLVCFVTRACHFEVVSSLSTEDFLNCLHRFIARRGRPTSIYSDNAKNFVGTATYLQLDSETIQRYAVAEGIRWTFIPPRAPHHGGIWEAAVKSAKYHLTRVMRNQTFTYEQYTTAFARIEAILNSRPLTYRIRSQDAEILTPGHFLIGDALCALPEPETSPNVKLTVYYDELQRRIQSFWIQWSRDYLAQLQHRTKWNTAEANLQPNDVVIIKDDLLKPACWNYGKIVETFPDPRGQVRVVAVQSNGSVKKRAVTSLVKLPTNPQ